MLNFALIPTLVTPPDAPQWIRQHATISKRTNPQKLRVKIFFSHPIMQQERNGSQPHKCTRNENIETRPSIHSKWISICKRTSSGSCLQGQLMKRWFKKKYTCKISSNLKLHQKEWPIYSAIFLKTCMHRHDYPSKVHDHHASEGSCYLLLIELLKLSLLNLVWNWKKCEYVLWVTKTQ